MSIADIIITNCKIITGEPQCPSFLGSVVVHGDRITRVLRNDLRSSMPFTGSLVIPALLTIDGTDLTLIPGLVDVGSADDFEVIAYFPRH